MATAARFPTRSAKIRAGLSHPVIDSDGHIMEFEAAVLDKLEEDEADQAMEHGLITEQDVRAFVFDNPVALWTAGDPSFFKGTVVAGQHIMIGNCVPEVMRGARGEVWETNVSSIGRVEIAFG